MRGAQGEELHFISAVTAQGIGGGTTVWAGILKGISDRRVCLHYSSLAQSVWGGLKNDAIRHAVHPGWKTYENRGYAFYDRSPEAFCLDEIADGSRVVFDSIEALRQLLAALHPIGL
jgi:hypothetical protein